MSFRKGKAEGGISHFKEGNDGRTVIAVDEKGNDLIVSHNRSGSREEAKKKTRRQVEALNERTAEDRKKDFEARKINL